jgi:hypothetical protein
MTHGNPYTENELKRAVALREQGLSWPTVAARLGRTSSALQVTVCKFRKGRWAPAKFRERSAQIDRDMEALIVSGVTKLSEIAAAMGVSEPAACQRLGWLGLDHEMRLELAASSNRRAAA